MTQHMITPASNICENVLPATPPNAVFLLPAATESIFCISECHSASAWLAFAPRHPVSDEPINVTPHTHSAVAASVYMCRIDHQCPRGWWGSPTCGPCDCDTEKGFDPNCNKTNGHCHCKVSSKHTHTHTCCHWTLLKLFPLTAVDSF